MTITYMTYTTIIRDCIQYSNSIIRQLA